jgi:L-lysine 2,3-aminomutase
MRWQSLLKENITSLGELLDAVGIPEQNRAEVGLQDYGFPVMVPRHFVSLIEKGNLNDPLLKQVLPLPQEGQVSSGFITDPLQEKQFTPVAGCLHKYQGRVLIITSGRCAINCRYCFRRHFPYGDHQITQEKWQAILTYIRHDASIREVIFSGGEPFIVSDASLSSYMTSLEDIEHVDTVRFHTRMLITLPQRMGESFFHWVSHTKKKIVIVVHVNHANELHPILQPLLRRLAEHGVTLLNQSVLLRDVNDTVDRLEALSRKLFQYGILPYYLHQLDPISGAQHFNVPREQGLALHRALRERCPGYLIPKYVVELAGLPYKEMIDASTHNSQGE